ncbi:hypothetical protein LWI29_026873 [Acer saccharum]|uniref:Uncharacterized protein n=1 Tax=Acer saccharum TaxID=4024 RepID=A0AA39VGM0_ACESA|nr:hypothetical protein LWI29_026873 [Acer saccharum]
MKCLRCEKAEESVEHALLWCRKAKEVWSKSTFWYLISNLKGLNSLDVLRFVFSKTRGNDLAFSVLFYKAYGGERNCFVQKGLLLAKRMDFKIDWVELDVVNVASGVNDVYVNDGLARVVLDDVRGLCREVGVSKCLSIPRQGNEMAHFLAARTFSSLEDRVWLN